MPAPSRLPWIGTMPDIGVPSGVAGKAMAALFILPRQN